MQRRILGVSMIFALIPVLSVGLGATAADAATEVISCQISADNPHGSVHVYGTINATATIKCTGANNGVVDTIQVSNEITAYKNGASAKSGTQTFHNAKTGVSNAAVNCDGASGGDVENFAVIGFVAPAGFSPASVSTTLDNVKPATCGTLTSVQPNAVASKTITFTKG